MIGSHLHSFYFNFPHFLSDIFTDNVIGIALDTSLLVAFENIESIYGSSLTFRNKVRGDFEEDLFNGQTNPD